jgi:FkbM family methyltransferase
MQSALQTCMQSDLSYELLVNAICRVSRLALLNDFIFNYFPHRMRPTKLESLQLLRQKGLPVATVLDVGVHQQTPELIRVYPDVRHILVEPAIEFHDSIRVNYAGIDHVLVPKACGEFEGAAFLNIYDITGFGGITHTTITDHPSSPHYRQIDITTLNSLILMFAPKGDILLKVDVDGVELKILKGAGACLQKCSCVVVEAALSIDNNLFFDRVQYMREQGFELWDIVDFCYYKDCLSQVDAVFVRHDIKANLLQLNPWHDGQVFDSGKWIALFQ